MRAFVSIAVTLGLFLAASSHAADRLLVEKPVPILTSSDPAIFPESWRRAPVAASGGILPPHDFGRATEILRRALQKYPRAVLKANLKAVYALSSLKYSGISAGGTNSGTVVYVRIGDEKMGYTDAQIEGVFHAEFSSILLRNFGRSFDAKGWREINPPDFHYLSNGVEAVRRHKANTAGSEALYQRGFLKEYSESDMENDFNAFAAILFSGDPARWQLATEYPKLHAKLRLALNFYARIDPTFTPAYFHHLKK